MMKRAGRVGGEVRVGEGVGMGGNGGGDVNLSRCEELLHTVCEMRGGGRGTSSTHSAALGSVGVVVVVVLHQ